MVESRMMDVYPLELVDLAEQARKEYEDLPERVIRRMVRDQLDKAKMRIGHVSKGGIGGMQTQLLEQVRRE
jgi:hypothetical protein